MKEIKPGIVFTVSHRMKNFEEFRREKHCFGFLEETVKHKKQAVLYFVIIFHSLE